MLCKFANLFNNPTYEICNSGFEPGQVVGPTGAGSGYGGRVAGGKKTMKTKTNDFAARPRKNSDEEKEPNRRNPSRIHSHCSKRKGRRTNGHNT
jgi:hypothetical protein